MRHRYVIFGAGPIAVALAYDLACFGEASEIVIADIDPARSKKALASLRSLLKKKIALSAVAVDAAKPSAASKLLKRGTALLSALPPKLNGALAKAALGSKAHYCDIGHSLESTRSILKLDRAARQAKISLVADCGLAPGLSTILAAAAADALDFPREVKIYFGELDAISRPLGEAVALDRCGMAECGAPAPVLRRGRALTLPSSSEIEELELPPFGRLEACLSGRSATGPWSFQNRLSDFECRRLLLPGHSQALLAMKELGFLDEQPVPVRGASVSPRRLTEALAATLKSSNGETVAFIQATARGKKHGRPSEVCYSMTERGGRDFGAADRAAGFCAATVSFLQASGRLPPGAHVPETGLPHAEFLQQLRRRGVKIQQSIRSFGGAA